MKDLEAIRARDAESGATWFEGPASFTAQSARDRRTLLAEVDRLTLLVREKHGELIVVSNPPNDPPIGHAIGTMPRSPASNHYNEVLAVLRSNCNCAPEASPPYRCDACRASDHLWELWGIATNYRENSQCHVPAGWKLVPLEATDGMIGAAHSSFNAIPDPGKFDPARHYRCMVKAAPVCPAQFSTQEPKA